eukprot:SAG11_NODE_20498_length_444_cov_0.602899_1_plen_26_part_01
MSQSHDAEAPEDGIVLIARIEDTSQG